MRMNLAKTMLAAAALAAGLCSMAHADVRGEAPRATAAPGHNGPRDPFTDGARGAAQADSLRNAPAVIARQGMSVCAVDGSGADQGVMRMGKPDPYTDGSRMGGRYDPFTDGARAQQGDGRGGACLTAGPAQEALHT
ncbi:hypothetical protein LMG23992_02349 [Cupriavidus laharis]|uniref:Uncharacterized protein n=1 Tax=Cupriavidus laharis TaxID=151654 RepID=A0ABM8WZ48_9BURK|nr:hypothetical protein [Cupriavidus laharis]CAG9172851.1 hypothetical protein LMG23992_02349 [Cupriavidus laharis]